MSIATASRPCLSHPCKRSVQAAGAQISSGPGRAAAPTGLSFAASSRLFSRGVVLRSSRHSGSCSASRHSLEVSSFEGFRFQGKNNFEVTEPIQEYAEEKIGHAIQHYTDGIKEVDVRFSVRGGPSHKEKGAGEQKTEVTAFTKSGVVRCEVADDNLYSSIDLVSDKLARKLRKKKERSQKKKKADKYTSMGVVEFGEDDEVPDLDFEPREASLPKEIVRTKELQMASMTAEDAVDAMVDLGHDFYAFKNKETGDVNIVYKRHVYGYGLLKPSAAPVNGAS